MPRRKPQPPGNSVPPRGPQSILELDRFTEASLQLWNSVSQDLDKLQDVLYFELEPERRARRDELIRAIQSVPQAPLDLPRWARIVTYQFSLNPLSCAGSLKGVGGRFNAGSELDANTLNPWPALYLAQDYETAFRERFQLSSDSLVYGLSPQELALEHGVSHSTLFVHGHLSRVFDMTGCQSLAPVAQVFRRIRKPVKARQIQSKLKIPDRDVAMAQTGKQIHEMVLANNWRVLPVQFGLPAPSHILAELIRAAGFEAILYRSTKGPGKCLAIFPDLLADGSFVELMDTPPPEIKCQRLDADSAEELAGWDSLPPRFRSRQ